MSRRPWAGAVLALTLIASVLALSAAPATSAPAVTFTPDRPLIDGETITVRGAGLPVGHQAEAFQCVLPPPADGDERAERCDLADFREGTINHEGEVQFRLPARRFIVVDEQPVDCADPGVCSIAVTTATDFDINQPYSATAAAPLAIDPELGTLPLELAVSIDEWDAHSVTATITCSTAVRVRFRARLIQHRPRVKAFVQDVQQVDCVDQITVHTLLSPWFQGTRPAGRLLPGPASLTVAVSGSVGPTGDRAQIREQVVLDDTTLRGQRQSSNGDGATIRLRGIRVTTNGRAVISAELDCPQQALVRVDAAVLAPAPGGASRIARTAPHRMRTPCTGTTRFELEVDTSAVRKSGWLSPQYRRADIIPAGPVEVHLLARNASTNTHSQVRRPVAINRPIRPGSITVPHRPDSRLRVGPVDRSGVRGSLACDQSGSMMVFATAGQRTGGAVLQASGSSLARCVAGRTVFFDIDWRQPITADRHTRVGLYAATGGVSASPAGPFDHRQGVWRRTE
ncbi:MAG: hypothetical protein ACR2QE_05500 [Acidimicrobiales bacterium]